MKKKRKKAAAKRRKLSERERCIRAFKRDFERAWKRSAKKRAAMKRQGSRVFSPGFFNITFSRTKP